MSTFDLCNAREQRFLYDLLQAAAHNRHDHPLPEMHALLVALERMWGGTDKASFLVPPVLMYNLLIYTTHAHRINDEDPEETRRHWTREVRRILQGFMESVAAAIQDGSSIKRKDDGVYIDLFRIPQWFYDEVVAGQYPLQPQVS